MITTPATFIAATTFALVVTACIAAPEGPTDDGTAVEDARVTPSTSLVGIGVGDHRRIPNDCRAVDPECELQDVADTTHTLDEALEAVGCSQERLFVSDPSLHIAFSAFVSYCPDTAAVQQVVDTAPALGLDAEKTPGVCDKCMASPQPGKVWVAWRANRQSHPNCGSGCKIPTWW